MSNRSAVAPWLVTLLLSIAIIVPWQVERHPRHHYSTEARVFGTIALVLALAVVFRFVAYLTERARG